MVARLPATSYIQHVAEWVGNIAAAKEEDWEYDLPRLAGGIATVVVSLDGAMIPMADSEGWREAMVDTLSFYDHDGERQHTIYLAAAPEHGKQSFTERLGREIARHAHCNRLKHDHSVLDELVAEAAQLSRRTSLSQKARDDAYSAWTYFNNHRHQMDYPGFLAENLPIGSGVTEAACKSLVKQRLCASGMRWKTKGAKIVPSLRSLTNTVGRWTQFWQKIDQYGAECFG